MPGRGPLVVWGTIAVVGAGIETWAIKTGRWEYTLSHVVRRAARTDSPIGSAAFAVGLAVGSHWFHHHILTK